MEPNTALHGLPAFLAHLPFIPKALIVVHVQSRQLPWRARIHLNGDTDGRTTNPIILLGSGHFHDAYNAYPSGSQPSGIRTFLHIQDGGPEVGGASARVWLIQERLLRRLLAILAQTVVCTWTSRRLTGIRSKYTVAGKYPSPQPLLRPRHVASRT